MATVTITYVAPVAPVARVGENIFPEYVLTGGYANNEKIIEENIYDNAPSGLGIDFDLDAWMSANTMHPGVLLAFKKAMADGEYEFTVADDIEAAYYEEVGTALADNGFTVAVA